MGKIGTVSLAIDLSLAISSSESGSGFSATRIAFSHSSTCPGGMAAVMGRERVKRKASEASSSSGTGRYQHLGQGRC
jgi:hypothetical protein